MIVFKALKKFNNLHEETATVLYAFRHKRQFSEQRHKRQFSDCKSRLVAFVLCDHCLSKS